MSHARSPVVSALVAWAIAVPVAGAAGPGRGSALAPYREEVVVRELEVDFDASVLPPLESLGRRADRDFLVLEDGRPLEQVATPAGDAEDDGDEREPGGGPCPILELLVWFDPALASPRARAEGARSLARAATMAAVPACVPITLAVEGSGREAPVASPAALAALLARRAPEWDSAPAAGRSPLEVRLRALDRLTVALASRDGGGRRALVVVGDAWAVNADLLNALADLGRGGDGPVLAQLRPIEDAARVAAAFGWTTYVLSAVVPLDSEVRPGPDRRPATRINSGGRESSSWMVRLFAPRHYLRGAARDEARLSVATDLGLRPWAHFVRAGAGTLLADAAAVASQMERLANRRRLVVRSPDPGPGRMLPLEVRWTGGDGRALPARRWSRSGMPPEATAARLRALAAGDLDVELGALVRTVADDSLPPARRVCFSGPTTHEFVRAATLSAEAAADAVAVGPVVEVRPFPAEACATLPDAQPSGVARTPEPALALVEDPESGEWGALRLPPAR